MKKDQNDNFVESVTDILEIKNLVQRKRKPLMRSLTRHLQLAGSSIRCSWSDIPIPGTLCVMIATKIKLHFVALCHQ